MTRVIIICEGPTEKEFCNTILSPSLLKKDIYIEAPLIKKSGGGIVKWSVLKQQITTHLKQDPNAYVTTLIDYYGLKDSYGFPAWTEAEATPNRKNRMEILENGMKESIEDSYRYRCIPYIQLHEFEALLFIDIEVFKSQVPDFGEVAGQKLQYILDNYPDPEMINNGKKTAPSKRLEQIIPDYNKVVYGNILAETIGLENIRKKCTRFDGWLTKIESL